MEQENKTDALEGILRAVSTLAVGGLKPPRLARDLTQETLRQFLKKFAEYKEKIVLESEDGVPRRPCGVIELISSSNLLATRALSGQRGELSQEKAIEALEEIERA